MKLTTRYDLDLGENSPLYAKLLEEEDFDFKTKNIIVTPLLRNSMVEIVVEADSIHDLKIGTTAVMKSLEVISKTLAV